MKTIGEMQDGTDRLRRKGRTIAFVPTMGYLHEGHLSLIREGEKHGDHVVLSIFVNPTQFGPEEDLDAYPRSIENDLALAEKEGVDTVFLPNEKDLYPERYETYVSQETLPNHLCGLNRPIHFRGVATVVTKLFNIVKPHVAVFGQKDYQQLLVIKQMVRDLNFGIEIIGAPTLRESDGLAMSSRNANLPAHLRPSARSLSQSMHHAQDLLHRGETDAHVIIQETSDYISSHPETDIDYVSLCDPNTLVDVDSILPQTLMALAVKVGGVRLIDSMILTQ
ncbi:MAG: pantoate--beta-alanine ligase [Desulfobacterales bacterium]